MFYVSFRLSASGILCFGPSTIASIALILSLFANSRCYLVDIDEDSFLRFIRPEPDSVGLWCFEATNGDNYDITNRSLGSKMDAARGLGTTTLVLGFCIWIFYLVAVCVRLGPGPFKMIGGLCILTCLFQGLVFLVFKSEVCDGDNRGCSLGVGGKCGVSATVFWFLAGIFSCAAGKKDDDGDAPVVEAHDDKAKDDETQDDKAKDEE
jgi:hypothetical protein